VHFPGATPYGSLGIGIALASYDGFVHWGFNSDPDVVPAAAQVAADVPPPVAPEKRKAARSARSAKVTNGSVAGATP